MQQWLQKIEYGGMQRKFRLAELMKELNSQGRRTGGY